MIFFVSVPNRNILPAVAWLLAQRLWSLVFFGVSLPVSPPSSFPPQCALLGACLHCSRENVENVTISLTHSQSPTGSKQQPQVRLSSQQHTFVERVGLCTAYLATTGAKSLARTLPSRGASGGLGGGETTQKRDLISSPATNFRAHDNHPPLWALLCPLSGPTLLVVSTLATSTTIGLPVPFRGRVADHQPQPPSSVFDPP